MDFAFTEEQDALRQLARKIFEDHGTHEQLRAVEQSPEWFHRALWDELARANLLGVALPEDVGGSGLGFLELAVLLEEQGRAVAPVPLWPTLALAALPINLFGSEAQRQRWLPGVARGETVLTAALTENGWDDSAAITATARRDGAVWRLDGAKACVPAAHLAARILVPARTGDAAAGVFLVDPRAAGVELQRDVATNGEPLAELRLSGATVGADDVLGDPQGGGAIVDWTVQRAIAALCATNVGVAEAALRMTASYLTTRKQFGKPLATFQAVAQRAADAFIQVEGMRWTAWQAVWKLAEGRAAREDVDVAKFWAAQGGHFTTYAAQHLHGGMGLDLDYPVHRYFLWSKAIELSLGGATQHLAKLGAAMANAESYDT
ncbi:acyl-CoA/acyl-ACP dehydrogenase [bacterium]|nr:acyl-CoA/acyl-ACP dehydrogenase [bacterium]